MDEKTASEYRKQLIDLEQSVHESYDKTLITLSGGALATSIAFLKDIVGDKTPICKEYATYAWISWSTSLVLLLMGLYFGTLAYRHAVKQLDENKLNEKNPGGLWNPLIKGLNAFGGITFVVGLIFFLIFAYKN